MPTRGSVIRHYVEQLLIANGVGSLPTQVETVSHTFGRAFTRSSDAIWIISAGVISSDLAEGLLVSLPVDTSETKGPVGLTLRADAPPSAPQALLMQTIRQAAVDRKSTRLNSSHKCASRLPSS